MTTNKQKSILDKPAPLFLKQWTPDQFAAMQKAIVKHFNNKYFSGRNMDFQPAYRNFEQLGEIFGLAYTSSSDYAGYWVCNDEIVTSKFPGYKYIGFAMSEDKKGYAVLWDKDENEIVIPL